jgi:hypothetical protein
VKYDSKMDGAGKIPRPEKIMGPYYRTWIKLLPIKRSGEIIVTVLLNYIMLWVNIPPQKGIGNAFFPLINAYAITPPPPLRVCVTCTYTLTHQGYTSIIKQGEC